MKKHAPRTRNELVELMDTRIAELRAAVVELPPNELSRWVVLSGHMMPLSFTVAPNGDITDCANASVATSTRFKRATAELVASKVRDGSGRHGIAMRLDNAFAAIIQNMQQTRDLLAESDARR